MNVTTAPKPDLMLFFDALADVQRLRLAGLLAEGPRDLATLGQRLGLNEPTVRRHLNVLVRTGLVEEGQAGFRLSAAHLYDLTRRVHASEATSAPTVERSLRPFLDASGRVLALPVHPAKLRALLRHVVGRFEIGRIYTEREVNAHLAKITDDLFALRRLLVDHGELARERDGSAYWRVEGP